jgi:hypothetical protein
LRKRNEEETNLRKQFEAKLNSLHGLVRDQEAKYHRALEEIDYLEKNKFEEEYTKLKGESLSQAKRIISLSSQLSLAETSNRAQ